VGTAIRERIPHCAPILQVVTYAPRYPELAPVSINVTDHVANSTHWTFRTTDGIHRFGVFIAKHLVDELVYNEKGNEVVLVEYLNPASIQST
jgi:hypothetical protein